MGHACTYDGHITQKTDIQSLPYTHEETWFCLTLTQVTTRGSLSWMNCQQIECRNTSIAQPCWLHMPSRIAIQTLPSKRLGKSNHLVQQKSPKFHPNQTKLGVHIYSLWNWRVLIVFSYTLHQWEVCWWSSATDWLQRRPRHITNMSWCITATYMASKLSYRWRNEPMTM
jgi:hypothetical protein